ncbi:putative DNA binding domain-containing protein [Holosporaceae bacterium 'Namur']|nr:putative DNA binding domain-containing protein [Holosporaceae bacterium 'Namur']
MKVEELIKQHESKILEFKENLNSKAKILATIIAFSNSSGGKLVIGINDKSHNIIGIQNPMLMEEALASLISDSIEPRILPNIDIIPWRDTHIIIVEVYPGPNRPYYLKSVGIESSTYVRVGSTNRLASQEIINVLKRSLSAKTFDEEIMYELNSEVINFRVASELFKPYRTLSEKDYYNLGIIAREQDKIYPSIGGILLFGEDRLKYFPDAWIQAGCFHGEDKSHIVDSQEIKDHLPIAVEQIITFIQKHLLTSITIEDIRNKEVWSIPKVAIREGIINSIVHTDYSLGGSPIRVSIFNNRIEIENPGLLPIGLTVEDITSGISKVRNRVIARVFQELHLIEKWGSGVQRMISSCVNAGLPAPKFEEIGTHFRVTLYKYRTNKPIILDNVENKIIELILTRGPLSTKEIADNIGFSARSIRSRLLQMIEKGKIVEIAKNPNDPKKKYDITSI